MLPLFRNTAARSTLSDEGLLSQYAIVPVRIPATFCTDWCVLFSCPLKLMPGIMRLHDDAPGQLPT